MSFHEDYDSWEKMTREEGCPVCQEEPMPEGVVDVYETVHSWLGSEPLACMKWACHALCRYHAVELYDLEEEALLGFMKDVQRYALALKTVTHAVKINYEIHGNTIPHLHVHLYPRFTDDPFPGQPIDYRKKRNDLYSVGEYEGFLSRIRKELDILFEVERNEENV